MPYKPNQFSDIPSPASMSPSKIQPPLNFADGGAVNWASDAQIYNTQSQVGNLADTPGGFGGMANQFTGAGPFGRDRNPFMPQQDQLTPGQSQDQSQGQYDFNLGTVLQPQPVPPPPQNPVVGSFASDEYNTVTPPLSDVQSYAKGGQVSGLVSRLRHEFSKRGLSFDAFLAHKLRSMQK